MNAPITITEVLGRAKQGMTRPFICRSDDGATCFVKGAYAGRRSLCCEWVANRLVRPMLPEAVLGVPPFRMAEVPPALIKGSVMPDIRDLGAGRVFASMLVKDGLELEWSEAQAWPEETKALLLLLDLWLQNEDRSLSALGGNPNLLVTPGRALEASGGSDPPRGERLWAYDFNLAFDPDFSRARFFDAHVFGSMLRQWPAGFRESMTARLETALTEVRTIFAELPLEWLHLDGDESLPVQLDVEGVNSILQLPFTESDSFWTLP
ncbi:HipA family kinase [Prosthecobacter sp.]|uniref:HipA family kinase n=1 Tax=Prosthecobacter sp. TaxID=1965333 RepID=UPI0037834698